MLKNRTMELYITHSLLYLLTFTLPSQLAQIWKYICIYNSKHFNNYALLLAETILGKI